jgi:hypothetical protein
MATVETSARVAWAESLMEGGYIELPVISRENKRNVEMIRVPIRMGQDIQSEDAAKKKEWVKTGLIVGGVIMVIALVALIALQKTQVIHLNPAQMGTSVALSIVFPLLGGKAISSGCSGISSEKSRYERTKQKLKGAYAAAYPEESAVEFTDEDMRSFLVRA